MARFLGYLSLLCAFLGGSMAWAAPPEAAVKAALVANLAQYAEWPDHAWSGNTTQATTLICVAGRGAVVDALQALDGRILYGRRISVSLRQRPVDGRDCQILFLGEGGRPAGEWVQELSSAPVLTVSEGDDFLGHGTMVGLVRENARVTFEVNLAAVQRANLRLSAQFLRLARTIYGRP